MVKAFEKDDVNEIYRILTERVIEGEDLPPEGEGADEETPLALADVPEEAQQETETDATEGNPSPLPEDEDFATPEIEGEVEEDDEDDLVPELPDAEPEQDKPFSWDEVEKLEEEREDRQEVELNPEPEPVQEPADVPAPLPEPIKISRMEEAPPVGLPRRLPMAWKEESSRLPADSGAIREAGASESESGDTYFKNESGTTYFKNEAKEEEVVNQETAEALWTVRIKESCVDVLSGNGDIHLALARGGKNTVRINGYVFRVDGDEISLAPEYPGVP